MVFASQVDCASLKRLINNSKSSDLKQKCMKMLCTYIYEGSVDVVCVLLPSFHGQNHSVKIIWKKKKSSLSFESSLTFVNCTVKNKPHQISSLKCSFSGANITVLLRPCKESHRKWGALKGESAELFNSKKLLVTDFGMI